jgi:hypothetical protein
MEGAGALTGTLEAVKELESKLEEEVRRLEIVTGVDNPMLKLLLKTLSVKNMEISNSVLPKANV